MTEATTMEPDAPAAEGDGWEWAIVEIFGHRRHGGRIREEERFGAKMLRIDVPSLKRISDFPEVDNKPPFEITGWVTHWYGGASIFSLTTTDEASVRRMNEPYEPAYRYSLPAPEVDEDPYDDEVPA